MLALSKRNVESTASKELQYAIFFASQNCQISQRKRPAHITFRNESFHFHVHCCMQTIVILNWHCPFSKPVQTNQLCII